MAKFVALQEEENCIVFAKLREDGSLVMQLRFYYPGIGGYAGMEQINLEAKGVQSLKALLSVTQPNKSLKSDGSALKLLRRIREKVLTDLDYDADEIVREIDAVLADAEAAA